MPEPIKPCAGKDGIVQVDGTALGFIKDWNLTATQDTSDVTEIGGDDWKRFLGLGKSWTLNINAILAYKDANQKKLTGQVIGKLAPIKALCKVDDATLIGGDTITTSVGITANLSDAIAVSIALQGTGPINESPIGGMGA